MKTRPIHASTAAHTIARVMAERRRRRLRWTLYIAACVATLVGSAVLLWEMSAPPTAEARSPHRPQPSRKMNVNAPSNTPPEAR